jgi:hypothetical protein
MKTGKSKAKGNAFENKIAKTLSKWMFNDDPNLLSRSITSGAKKSAYLGDIVPQMQLPWKNWIFNIECKHGYKGNIPNLNNQTIVRGWLDKVIIERDTQELIIYLIIKFHGYSTILLTDLPFEGVTPSLILNHASVKDESIIPFHLYNFDELIEENNFYDLYNNNQKLKEVFNT